jgi:hypothetical protein
MSTFVDLVPVGTLSTWSVHEEHVVIAAVLFILLSSSAQGTSTK